MKAHLPVCVICMSLGFQMWCLFADSSGDGGHFPLFVWFFFYLLAYLQLSTPGKGRWMSTWTPGHTRCVWKIFVCAQASLWLLERHIKLNWGTQERPHFKNLWQSRHQILEFWYRWYACTRRESRAQYPVPWKTCADFVGLSAVCDNVLGGNWVFKTLAQPPQNICDWWLRSATVISHLIRLVRIKTLCFPNSQDVERSVEK